MNFENLKTPRFQDPTAGFSMPRATTPQSINLTESEFYDKSDNLETIQVKNPPEIINRIDKLHNDNSGSTPDVSDSEM